MKGSNKIIDEIIESHASDPGGLIPTLLKIHEEFGCIPEEAYPVLLSKFAATRIQINKILHFYDEFASDFGNKIIIRICGGFGCSEKGSLYLYEKMKQMIAEKKTIGTDINVSVETIPCQGLCGFGPIIVINHQVYTRVTAEKAEKILSDLFFCF